MQTGNTTNTRSKWPKYFLILGVAVILAFGVTGAVVYRYGGIAPTYTKLRQLKRKVCRDLIGRELKIRQDGMDYANMFNDKNNLQLQAARKYGIKQRPQNRAEARRLESQLVKIESNDAYVVDELTHSVPYLTHGSAEVLEMIGRNFQDSLKSKGLTQYGIIVTSVLRTQDDIKKLRRSGNPNAVSNSAHCYATTFDITYARFKKQGFSRSWVSEEGLTNVLAQVLRDLKKEKLCYVKYEYRQQCFHITARKHKTKNTTGK